MMIKWKVLKLSLLIFCVSGLSGCSSEISDYQASTPKFELFEYFSGNTQAWGMVQDYKGVQTRRFTVSLFGEVEDRTLTLTEDFVFDDGEVSQRIWVITRLDDGTYQGEADDIIGYAVGQESGNALWWQYDFELKMEDSTVTVFFDDWLYRQDEKRVFNVTSIKKFGIEVGKVTLFFEKI